MTSIAERLEALVDSKNVDALVRIYFTDPSFAGSLFDRLGTNDFDNLTHDDLLAVSLLDVRFKPAAMRELLDKRADIHELLRRMPTDRDAWDLVDEDDAWLAGDQLWNLFNSINGIKWVKANKLLARKRPRLWPVYDSVTKEVLNPDSKRFAHPLRRALREHPWNQVRDGRGPHR